MATLDSYLNRKAAVLAQRQADFRTAPEKAVVNLKVSSWVAGDTGARPTRMGETVFITDAAPALAGHALGPTAPEMLLGSLASCLIHTYLIQAALMSIPLDHVEVDVSGSLDMQGVVGLPYDQAPLIQNIAYSARLTTPASEADQARMHAAVAETCPVLNTLRYSVEVTRQDA